jgi:hypothetical protein
VLEDRSLYLQVIFKWKLILYFIKYFIYF